MNPDLIGFLFKQFAQSIFRYPLDNLYIGESKLDELDVRQNLLIKRAIGIKKLRGSSPLNKVIKIDSIKQLYMKHKMFFLKQLMNDKVCKDVLLYLKGYYRTFDRQNTTFCKQLDYVGKKIFIDCAEYSGNISLALIDDLFKCKNDGLVDSIKFIFIQIKSLMNTNLEYFYLYELVNDLLKINFYT